MVRLGLCCVFRGEPIKFRRATARYLSGLNRKDQLRRLADIVRHNGESLLAALRYCHANGIGAFRINSQILPLKTHPDVGYDIQSLPNHTKLVDIFKMCGSYSRRHDLRTSFHPDQFIVLSSPRPDVVRQSVAELVYQAEVAEWVGADVINIHGGGAYGDKSTSLQRLKGVIRQLPVNVRSCLTLENDDRVYTPQDLLPLCRALGVPLVYDVHHHRCLPDGKSVAETTLSALETWNREPLFHLSSPFTPWGSRNARPHADYIHIEDFPKEWMELDITVEVEAKAKELAVLKLRDDLLSRKTGKAKARQL